jgi:hypothetical protein
MERFKENRNKEYILIHVKRVEANMVKDLLSSSRTKRLHSHDKKGLM